MCLCCKTLSDQVTPNARFYCKYKNLHYSYNLLQSGKYVPCEDMGTLAHKVDQGIKVVILKVIFFL